MYKGKKEGNFETVRILIIIIITHTHTHTGTVTVTVHTRRMATERQRHPEKRDRCLGRVRWGWVGGGVLTRNCEGG